jgi:diguanylate cyclase (GGDEF)-like protein
VISVTDFVFVLTIGALASGRWRHPPWFPTLVQAVLDVAICSVGGLVAVFLVVASTWAISLFVAFAVAADLGYRATVRASQRHADLEKLYDFTRSLGPLTGERDVIGAVLEEARRLFAANCAELVVPLKAPLDNLVLRCELRGDAAPEFHDAMEADPLDMVVAERGLLLFTKGSDDALLASAMAGRGVQEALVAPLQLGDPTSGYILVADRAFTHEGFKPVDLRFLGALATNAGVALRSRELLERLKEEAAARRHEAQYDALTGLANRALFYQRLSDALAKHGARVAVMLTDLDGFREVNDTLGHSAGDAILIEIARRLAALVGEGGLVARLGGDEFALLVEDAPQDALLMERAEEVIAAFSQPYLVEGLQLYVRASLGFAVSPGHGSEPGRLLRHADVAMYGAKDVGGGARLYEPARDRSTLRRLRLATELRRAIEAGELDVWYQPAVDLVTGDAVGCEALLRWNHDQFGPISPDEFIPVAENAGLIDPLTFFVLDEALGQLKSWRELVPDLGVSVNVSARSLVRMSLADRVMAALERAGLRPEVLTLELTESSMMTDALGDRVLRSLSDLGVSLSIDDFGTGYSSLSRLKSLPFHEVKIDKSFVLEMLRDRTDDAVVRSTIELARSLERTVVAEGVEDEPTMQRLAYLKCNTAQGFYLARPMPAHQCETWLVTTQRLPASRVVDLSERSGAELRRPGA